MILEQVEVRALIRPVLCEEARDLIRSGESVAGRICGGVRRDRTDKALAREDRRMGWAAVKFVLIPD